MSQRKSVGKRRILIVDDHPVMRQGLNCLIREQPDLSVSGEAGTATQALNLISARKPELVVADLSLPDRNGFELLKDIQVFHPELPVLVYSMLDEVIYAERVLRAGGRGYIMKRELGSDLLRAIRQVLEGRIYVSEKMSARILEVFSGQNSSTAVAPMQRLTDREFEVFHLIGEGRTTREISERLHISVKTAEVHRSKIKTKLELKSGADLVRFAIRCLESGNSDFK